MENITIKNVTAELHKAFQIFNTHYFKNDLPIPAITIQSSGHKRKSMGWCSQVPVWGDKDGKSVMYELNLSIKH